MDKLTEVLKGEQCSIALVFFCYSMVIGNVKFLEANF